MFNLFRKTFVAIKLASFKLFDENLLN